MRWGTTKIFVCLLIINRLLGKNFKEQFDLCVLLNDIFRRGSQKHVEIQNSAYSSVGQHREWRERVICGEGKLIRLKISTTDKHRTQIINQNLLFCSCISNCMTSQQHEIPLSRLIPDGLPCALLFSRRTPCVLPSSSTQV